jgi:hypothetical protein
VRNFVAAREGVHQFAMAADTGPLVIKELGVIKEFAGVRQASAG